MSDRPEDWLDVPPVRDEQGRDLCPRCGAVLERRMVRYSARGVDLGEVEQLVCPKCRYGVLTETGYEEARRRLLTLTRASEKRKSKTGESIIGT